MRDLTYPSQISEDGTDEDIQYWIYEFQMPDEEKKRLLDMAASLGITTDEFVQASFRYAMDHPEESERVDWLLNGDEGKKLYPADKKLIDWLWEHPEIREELWKQMEEE